MKQGFTHRELLPESIKYFSDGLNVLARSGVVSLQESQHLADLLAELLSATEQNDELLTQKVFGLIEPAQNASQITPFEVKLQSQGERLTLKEHFDRFVG